MTDVAARLAAALPEYEAFAKSDPKTAERLLRQPGHFLVLDMPDPRFLPIRHLLSYPQVPFEVTNARSLSMENEKDRLIAMGLSRVSEDSPFFNAIYLAWETQCLATGKKLSKYEKPSARTGRVFWIAPGPFPPA